MNSAALSYSLRIFISSTDQWNHELLSEWILCQAKSNGLAGTTILKGILGFGASSVIHAQKFWEIADKVPVMIEIVDQQAKVKAFYNKILPVLESMRYGCLVTLEEVEVLLYKSGHPKNHPEN